MTKSYSTELTLSTIKIEHNKRQRSSEIYANRLPANEYDDVNDNDFTILHKYT